MFKEGASVDFSINRRSLIGMMATLAACPAAASKAMATGVVENIRDHGARGNGYVIDSGAINSAIAAAARRGGGVVSVPPGRYLSFSIRLLDNITLALSEGAVIEAADPSAYGENYDPPENYLEQQFQDFGITHVDDLIIWQTLVALKTLPAITIFPVNRIGILIQEG